jgi:hypothetical protein
MMDHEKNRARFAPSTFDFSYRPVQGFAVRRAATLG